MLRALALLVLLFPFALSAHAQRLSGHVAGAAGRTLVLQLCRGEQCDPFDSTRIDAQGAFALAPRLPGPGLYQLALSDTDRVQVILDGREPEVVLEFAGVPLDQHLQVRASDQNQRLLELHAVSREADAVRLTTYYAKRALKPTDYDALRAQDSIANRAERMRADHVRRLIDGAPDSYFAELTRADAALASVAGESPMAVAQVFDLSDPSLMRSPLYDRAIMTFLRNVNAVHEDQFLAASDSLMALSGRNAECQAYMLEHLLDLFSTYGPERAAQYLLDKYVVQAKVPVAMSPVLRGKVAEMMKVAVGATGPDLELNDRGTPFTLAQEAKLHRYTLLFFYASTCEHCQGEIPRLKELYTTYAPKGLGIIGIALDADSAEFEQRIQESGITWPCYSEFIGWGARAVKAYQVKATPALFLLDAQLHIVAKPYDAAALGDQLPGFLP